MSKEDLMKMNKKELSEICKANGIARYRGKTEIPKGEMIEAILKANETNQDGCNENVQGEEKIEDSKGAKEKEKAMAVVDIHISDKLKYIEEATPGTIIAFYDDNGKPNTAALVNRSSSRKMLKLVTQYEKEFIIPYENVIWVRTTKLWPNKIYNLLKNKVVSD